MTYLLPNNFLNESQEWIQPLNLFSWVEWYCQEYYLASSLEKKVQITNTLSENTNLLDIQWWSILTDVLFLSSNWNVCPKTSICIYK